MGLIILHVNKTFNTYIRRFQEPRTADYGKSTEYCKIAMFLIILTTVYNTDGHSNFHLLFGMKNIFHPMSHEKLSAGQNSRCEAKSR